MLIIVRIGKKVSLQRIINRQEHAYLFSGKKKPDHLGSGELNREVSRLGDVRASEGPDQRRTSIGGVIYPTDSSAPETILQDSYANYAYLVVAGAKSGCYQGFGGFLKF